MPLKLVLNVLWGVGWMLGITRAGSSTETSILRQTTAISSSSIAHSVAAGTATQSYIGRHGQGPEDSVNSASPRSLSESVGAMMESGRAASPSATLPGGANDTNRNEHEQSESQGDHQPQVVRRGDGQILPDRDESKQPRNPKKRMMEEPVEAGKDSEKSNKDEL